MRNSSNNHNQFIQTIETKTTRIIDHGTTLTTITKVDSVITLGIETTTIQTNKEIIFSHHIEIRVNNQAHKVKTTEIVHQNTKHKSIKNYQQMKPIQINQILTIAENQNHLNHEHLTQLHCETTVD